MLRLVTSSLDTLLGLCYYSPEDKAFVVAKIVDFLGWLGKAADIPRSPSVWESFITDDHSPIEFSITYSTNERPVVRFIGEPLPPAVNDKLSIMDLVPHSEVFLGKASTAKDTDWRVFESLKKLFLVNKPSGNFYMWFGVDLNPAGILHKIYFNPQVDKELKAKDRVLMALKTLEIPTDTLETMVSMFNIDDSAFQFVGIDLHKDPRLKIYIRLHGLDRATLLKMVSLCYPSMLTTVSEFWTYFSSLEGGETTPRSFSSTASTLGIVFTLVYSVNQKKITNIKVHFPFRHYFKNDMELSGCIQKYLNDKKYVQSSNYQETLQKFAAHRSLSSSTGVQTLVGISSKNQGLALTIYLSPELYKRI